MTLYSLWKFFSVLFYIFTTLCSCISTMNASYSSFMLRAISFPSEIWYYNIIFFFTLIVIWKVSKNKSYCSHINSSISISCKLYLSADEFEESLILSLCVVFWLSDLIYQVQKVRLLQLKLTYHNNWSLLWSLLVLYCV